LPKRDEREREQLRAVERDVVVERDAVVDDDDICIHYLLAIDSMSIIVFDAIHLYDYCVA
jgi:hypothetical protein